jgi:hypothetical protein
VSPDPGTLWYNSTTPGLYVWDGDSWYLTSESIADVDNVVGLPNTFETILFTLSTNIFRAVRCQVSLYKGTSTALYFITATLNTPVSGDPSRADYSVEGGYSESPIDVVLKTTLSGTGATSVLNVVAQAYSSGWTARSRISSVVYR